MQVGKSDRLFFMAGCVCMGCIVVLAEADLCCSISFSPWLCVSLVVGVPSGLSSSFTVMSLQDCYFLQRLLCIPQTALHGE